MARKAGSAEGDRKTCSQARVTTAPCVPAIRKAVKEWREKKYKGATDTTKTLLQLLVRDRPPPARRPSLPVLRRAARSGGDARLALRGGGGPAAPRSRRALREGAGHPRPAVRRLRPVRRSRWRRAAARRRSWRSPSPGNTSTRWPRARDDYAKTFLIVAPNVIVFERLRSDFGGGRVFRTDPIIPPELRIFWEMDFYMRGDPERASSQGALYLTNIQQFYERPGDRRFRRAGGHDRRARTDRRRRRAAWSRTSMSASRLAGRLRSSSTTRATTSTTRRASGARSSAASTTRARRACSGSSTSRRRLATRKAACSPGPSSTTR